MDFIPSKPFVSLGLASVSQLIHWGHALKSILIYRAPVIAAHCSLGKILSVFV